MTNRFVASLIVNGTKEARTADVGNNFLSAKAKATAAFPAIEGEYLLAIEDVIAGVTVAARMNTDKKWHV